MENVNFIVIGHVDSDLLVVHKNDYKKLIKETSAEEKFKYFSKINSFKVDLNGDRIFGPSIIDIWLKYIDFEEVGEEEQDLYIKIIERKLSDSKIKELQDKLDENKYIE